MSEPTPTPLPAERPERPEPLGSGGSAASSSPPPARGKEPAPLGAGALAPAEGAAPSASAPEDGAPPSQGVQSSLPPSSSPQAAESSGETSARDEDSSAAGEPAGPGPGSGERARTPALSGLSPLGANQEQLELPSPAAALGFEAGLSTLQDVRRGLFSEEADEQSAILERNLGKAERRVARLLSQGHDPRLLEGRLAAAQVLHEQGERRSALLLVEELLVLAKAMHEHGPVQPEARSEGAGVGGAALERRLEELVACLEDERALADAAHRREFEAAQILIEEEVEALRERALPALRYEVRRAQERSQEALAEDLTRATEAHLEERLTELLSSERFAAAAAHAIAAKPYELLDRPELLARIDAVASRLDEAVLERGEVREAIDAKVRDVLLRFIRGGDLARAVEPLLREGLAGQSAPSEALTALERRIQQAREESRATASEAATARERAQALEGELRQVREEVRAARAQAQSLAQRLEAAESSQLQGVEERLAALEAGAQSAASALPAQLFAELQRAMGDADFRAEVAEVARGAVDTELSNPERLSDVVARVAGAQELVAALLNAEAFGERLAQERRAGLEEEEFAKRVRRLVEQVIPRSRALPTRVVEVLDDPEGGAPVVDRRIDERVAERSDALLDQRSLKRRVVGAVRAEMVEEVFRRNVDARVQELAEEGFLAKRMRAILSEEMGPALDNALSSTDLLRRLVLKEIRNREALKTAQLTGDGLSDPATAVVRSAAMEKLLEEKIQAALKAARPKRPGGPRG